MDDDGEKKPVSDSFDSTISALQDVPGAVAVLPTSGPAGSPRPMSELKKLWARSFLRADPRQHLVDYFKPGDERGPFGYLRAQGLRPNGPPANYFSIWRPTSLTAIRMLYDGTATGKGLNVKGKSAREGPLSGFVPFVQISEEADKHLVSTLPPDARTRIFYRTASAREQARAIMQSVAVEMEAGARLARQQLSDARAAVQPDGGELTREQMADAALRATTWHCDRFELVLIDEYAPSGVFGLDVPDHGSHAARTLHSPLRDCALFSLWRVHRVWHRYRSASCGKHMSCGRTSRTLLGGRRAGRASQPSWTSTYTRRATARCQKHRCGRTTAPSR